MMSRGHSQPRTQIGRRILDRCNGKTERENVVIIDVEEDSHSAGINIREDNKSQPSDVINIDDDDEEEENHVNLGNGNEACPNDGSHSTSNRAYYPTSSKSSSSDDLDDDKYNFIRKRKSSGRLTHNRKRFSRYRFGLISDSDESSSSESDLSDCEIMEGSEGNIRVRWEQAALSKKIQADMRSGQSGSGDQGNAYESDSGPDKDSDTEYTAEQCAKYQTCATSSNSNKEKEDNFASEDTDVNVTKDPLFSSSRLNPTEDSAQNAGFGGSSKCKLRSNDPQFSYREKFEKQPISEACLFNTHSYDQTDNNFVNSTGQNDEGIFCGTSRKGDETEGSCKRTCGLDKDETIHGEEAICQQDEAQIKHGENYSKDEEEPVLENLCNIPPIDENHSLMPAQDRDRVQNDLIGEREKFKETDEYKRAAEKEWESRNEQLRIQSEEAKRLRKRKQAETLRLLDVERRQKKRVEEMREMKKKNEESINLKEQVRVEVRNELDKLERQYTDMASLLRRLGVDVGGGMRPMPHEVHAAYKKALLRFHPDRASKTDLRQQVEAEEKFKLISRSKEKLLLT